MATKKAPFDWRKQLEYNATFDHNSAVILGIVRSRDAGLTRQKTVEEIAADMEAARLNPPEIITHPSGQTHVATLGDGRPYRCRECGEA